MDQPKRAHLRRREVFHTERDLLYVSDPVTRGENGPHDHDFVELVLVVGGAGLHRSAHGEQQIGRGDFFVLRPGAWHAYRECRDLQVYNCCCAPELLRRELAMIGEDPAITQLLWTEPLAPGRRGVQHRRLTEEQTKNVILHWEPLLNAPFAPFVVKAGHLLVLLGQIAGAIYPGDTHRYSSTHPAVRQGVQLLENGYEENWDLARLAGLVRLNPSYLVRLFKSATGRAPMEYLARHRCEVAANLLLTTDQPVSAIGARVGWHNPNYFARRFKSAYGMPPSAYREQRTAL